MYNQVFNPQVQHNAESVKKIINTPAVLIISLLSFATAVLKFFAKGLILSDEALYFIYRFMRESGVTYDDSESFVSSLRNNSGAGSLDILSIIMGFLFLMIYLSSKKSDSSVSTFANGFRIFSIVMFVFTCIGTALFALGVFILIGIIMEFPADERVVFGDFDFSLYSIFITIGILLLLIAIYSFYSALSQMRFSTSIRNSITTAELTNKGAAAFGVFQIISSVFTGVYLILLMKIPMTKVDSLTVLSMLCSIGTGISMAVFAFNFSGKISVVAANQPAVNYENYTPYGNSPQNAPFYNGADINSNPYNGYYPQPVFCRNCGAQLNENDKFCIKCGTKRS